MTNFAPIEKTEVVETCTSCQTPRACQFHGCAANAAEAMLTLGEQIAQALVEYDSWTKEKRASVHIEGGD